MRLSCGCLLCICMYVCMCVCVYLCMYMYVCVCVYIYVCICMCVCVCIFMYVYVCVCVCVYIYIYMGRWVVNSVSDIDAVKLQPRSCRKLRKNTALYAYWSMMVLQNWRLECGRRLTRNASNSRSSEFKPDLLDRSSWGFRDCILWFQLNSRFVN